MKVILFDGICNLCSGTVLFIIRRDKKALFRFAALQSGAGQSLLKKHHLINEQNETIYYLCDNSCYSESTAVLHILRDLGRGWQLLYAFILIPACIRDTAYRLISRNRYRLFGKKEACMLPDPDIKNRFLGADRV